MFFLLSSIKTELLFFLYFQLLSRVEKMDFSTYLLFLDKTDLTVCSFPDVSVSASETFNATMKNLNSLNPVEMVTPRSKSRSLDHTETVRDSSKTLDETATRRRPRRQTRNPGISLYKFFKLLSNSLIFFFKGQRGLFSFFRVFFLV